MKKIMLATLATASMLATPALAQLDVGGAISGAIRGATGGNQAGTAAGAQAGAQAGANGSGVLPGGNLNSGAQVGASGTTNQTWLGRVGNDLRNAIQPGANGSLQLQDNVNPSLQQYGFRSGDQIIGANGQPLTQAQFDQYLQQNQGQVRVLRNGQTVVLGGNAGYQQPGQVYGQQGQVYGQGQAYAGGQAYSGSRNTGRQRFGITMNPSKDGVVVSAVTVGSPASKAGIRPGDQIISVNGQAVNNPNDMIQLVGSAEANDNLDVQFKRQGQEMQSQVVLASATNMQSGGAYQAGYAQGMDGQSGSNSGSMQQRLDKLERMVQELRDELRQQRGQSSDNSNEQNSDTNNSGDSNSGENTSSDSNAGNNPPQPPAPPEDK